MELSSCTCAKRENATSRNNHVIITCSTSVKMDRKLYVLVCASWIGSGLPVAFPAVILEHYCVPSDKGAGFSKYITFTAANTRESV